MSEVAPAAKADLTVGELEELAAQYYRHIPEAELQARPPEEREGVVRSHRLLASQRPQGTSLVRAFVPDRDRDGWDARGHIVVQIATLDRPFLVDSVMSFLTQAGFGIDRLVHPQLAVRRDVAGTLRTVEPPGADGPDVTHESWMHLEVDASSDPDATGTIERGLQSVLRDVQEVVEDWAKMKDRALRIVGELQTSPPPVPSGNVDEARRLLAWLAEDNFTFMGYREYELVGGTDDERLRAVPGTGLGLLRSDQRVQATALPPRRVRTGDRTVLVVTKANARSTVHRPVYLDHIAVSTFDESGEVTGERRFLGLFTSSAYTGSVRRIPILGHKVDLILERLGFEPDSHNGKAVIDLLETYPRDELFQTSVEVLTPIAGELLRMRERRQVRLFLRRDDDGRFLSCLVYMPRDRYTTDVRLRIESVLTARVGGRPTVDYTVWVTESLLARVNLVVRPERGQTIGPIDAAELERQVAAAARSWEDDFASAVDDVLGEAATTETMREYGGAFPEAYKEDFDATAAVEDLAALESLRDAGPREIRLAFTSSTDAAEGEGRFKIHRVGEPLVLTDILPFFASLGVDVIDERPYHLERASGPAWVYDFGLRYQGGGSSGSGAEGLRLFKDAFLACWRGDAEADGFNRLVLAASLSWRQVVVVRAYAAYLRQAGTPFSQVYLESCLLANVPIVTLLVQLFEARFDPALETTDDRAGRIAAIEEPLAELLDQVESLDADRILRSYRALVQSTLRTSFYRTDAAGEPLPYVSLKLDARSIEDLPRPRPRFEIFCYSPRVEGVHLRFGPVARGGLRWSDRRDDFRTEILGLVKAQMVKNAVIVPVGSKGGFYCKQLPDPAADRDAWLAEGVACYTAFISSLLDITDNRRGTETVPPRDVVRWDGDDSYLVVAADKGTATFSDIANGISASYGFWLGDAFASGGSVGYDHKAMGITARGAWVSVRRHFREMGIDCQQEDFSCVGIGDMSGDVFGNGMLLSEHTRLVAAFDHRDIFLDPDPDPTTSFGERRRLFELPRSSWQDYDAALLSEGGGIFSRSRKSIPLTPQVRTVLGIDDSLESMSPPQLLSAILTAPVDLLWNGGIGTYVKAEAESHDDVGDKANNAIRVDGTQLRCRCVGEGGNLGLTQLGRIEYALSGGRLTTDFIDNSAGVDTSDHEVNIKILLDRVVERGDLTVQERNQLLPPMTDEVARLVLEDNYEQNVSLSGSVHDAFSLLHSHAGWITRLERAGHLDRTIEYLPSDKQIAQRHSEGIGLTSPELSVLLAYTKIVLADDLLESGIADEDYFRGQLFSHFPTPLRQQYRADMEAHPLRREIVVTRIVNAMVNAAGISFYHRLSGETGATAAELARAHTIGTEVYAADALEREVRRLDNVVDAEVQERMRGQLQALVERASRWLVNKRRTTDVEKSVDYFGTLVQELVLALPDLLVGRERSLWEQGTQALVEAGAPQDVAARFASLGPAYAAMAVADLARQSDVDILEVAAVHFHLAQRLGIDRLVDRISSLPRDDRWRTMARAALRDDLQGTHAELTRRVLETTDSTLSADARVQAWSKDEETVLDRAGSTLEEIWSEDTPDLARLSVGLRVVRTLLA